MRISIVGAGNMGLCMLGYLVSQGHDVTLYTSSQKLHNKTLILKNHETNVEEKILGFKITSSVSEAFSDCEVIFCTYPAFLRKEFIQHIENVINPYSILCFIPGYGGAEYYCRKLLSRGVRICGFQRVPYVARYDEEENCIIANILSIKQRLFVAAIPKQSVSAIAELMGRLLNIPTTPLKEYLAVTMSPSNPLLHISGLYGFFGDKPKEKVYSKELRFYDEWNDRTSYLLFDYDKELHRICDAMSDYFVLDEIVPLSEYYESPTPQDMTRKLKSIEPFKVVKMPLKEIGKNQFVVDTDSRMFIEDFPFGVCMFKAFGLMTGIETPIIDSLLKFYTKYSGKRYFKNDGSFDSNIDETAIPQLKGINNLNELKLFYS